MRRREFLTAWAALGLTGMAPARAWAAAAGSPPAFDYAWLKGEARTLAAQPYRPPPAHLPAALENLDWDQYQALRFRPDHALWAESDGPFRLQFFHLGLHYRTPVQIHELNAGGARPLAYQADMFDYGRSGLRGARLPADLGFAGFRVQYHTDWQRDIVAFLGASYFRAVGAEMQYGLSARGLAVDCGMERPEEFPVFRAFWIERPATDADRLTVYALLDSPSVAGAYRFDIFPGATLRMEVDCALYPRLPIERLGVAPLTSMFQHGENDIRMARDWRPEIHDSDGLSLWTGAGEWLWRPLANPAQVRFNAYLDENPRGFGLLQRDRAFDHYQDDGVFYEKRPSLWIEPKAGWGRGSVHLLELPTPDETMDNIVAYWNPERKPQPGEEWLFSYRMHWGARMPYESPLAQVAATRNGLGGVIGRPRTHFSWRFVVDFAGGPFGMLGEEAAIEPVISVSRGEIEIPSVRPLRPLAGYRAIFDWRPTDDGTAPVDLRVYLRLNGRPLSETWLYQWTPPGPEERRALLARAAYADELAA